jgi:ribonuclease R
VDDDALRVVAARSGDVVALGDRIVVEVTDAAVLRRTVYGKRVGGGGTDGHRKREKHPPNKQDKRQKHKIERAGRREKKFSHGPAKGKHKKKRR